MPEVKPFPAVLFNLEKVKLDRVIAPPYDVIDTAHQSRLYDADDHNIVRVILNRDADRYASSKDIFHKWKNDRVLVTDDRPAMYVLSQRYKSPEGAQIERTGFIVACKLEEIGKGSVLPHEKTHSKPKEDRLKLLNSMGTMFSQIFGIYSDAEHVLDEILAGAMDAAPTYTATYEDVESRVWPLREGWVLGEIAEYMHDQKVLIADGHHRYETALAYAAERRAANPKHTGREAYNYVPMFLTNMFGAGLAVHPTHRLVHSVPGFDAAKLTAGLEKLFTIENVDSVAAMKERLAKHTRGAFGYVLPGAKPYHVIVFKDSALLNGTDPLARLDVSILHDKVIKGILGITDEEQTKKTRLEYAKEISEAVDAVKNGTAQAAFIMNPTKVEDVCAVAEAGKVMPQKSTYFFPKLLSGLVNYSFVDG